jgi:hypothetical protein
VKFKNKFRRRSVAAPKVAIKTQLPWPIKIAFTGILLGLGIALALWAYELGRGFTSSRYTEIQQLEELKERLSILTAEHDQFSSTANAAESRLVIERSAAKQLAAQVKALEAENSRLKEDLAFFESLLPASTGAQGVAIRRIKIENVGQNQLRYRLLLMQGGKGTNQFVGSLQFALTVVQDGKSAMMIFPERNSAEPERDKFQLSFKHYQRVEGILSLPEGAIAKSIQVRVLEKGQIRAQQSANL